MKRQAVVWKESIYKNRFRCSCGAKLADANGLNFEDHCLIGENEFRVYLHCSKCLKPVAYLTHVNVSENEGGMMGNINDFERKTMN